MKEQTGCNPDPDTAAERNVMGKPIGPHEDPLAAQVALSVTRDMLANLSDKYDQTFRAALCGNIEEMPVIVISRPGEAIICWGGSSWIDTYATLDEAEWDGRLLVLYCRQREIVPPAVGDTDFALFKSEQPVFAYDYAKSMALDAPEGQEHVAVMTLAEQPPLWITIGKDEEDARRAATMAKRVYPNRGMFRDVVDILAYSDFLPTPELIGRAREQERLVSILDLICGQQF